MKNNKINSKNEYLNSIINNDSNNDNSIIDLENHFKNLNINARPNKNIKKGKNLPKNNFEHSFTKSNNFINDINPNLNENYGSLKNKNIIINDYNNNNKMPKIYGGNDNNYNKQLNANNSINVHNYSYDDEYLIPGYNQTIKSNFYKKIYGDINICNSILIILNNNEDIKNYLNKSKRKQEITFLRFAVGYSLGNILYQSHQYLWNKEKINSKDIFNKYTDFASFKFGQNDKYLFDINNTEHILDFIYSQINCEFTHAKNTINMNTNNINNNDNVHNNKFVDDFKRFNKSIISDAFTGFYKYNNGPNKELKSFSFIKFNLNEINRFYDSINSNEMNLNHFYNNINLYNCFDYTFKDKTHSIYSFPKFLTIVLSQTDKCNFILHNELNLASYTNKFSNNNNGFYLLTSILCQMNYNKKFIIYIFDQQEGFWFSLSDQGMRKVDSINNNAIPLIVIYQLRNTFQQEYKEIKIKDKLFTIVNFSPLGGLCQNTQLFFDEKDTIRDARNKIQSWFNIKNSFTLLINGSVANKDEVLSKVLKKGNNILVLLKTN